MKTAHIFETSMGNLKPLFYQGHVVYKQYNKIRNYLIQHLGEEYATFFAEPVISDPYQIDEKGVWQTELEPGNVSTLAELEQTQTGQAFLQKMAVVTEKVNELLRQSNYEDRHWGELLKICLVIPDKHHVLIKGEEGSLVAWGFERMDRNQKAVSILTDLPLPKAKPKTQPSEIIQQSHAAETSNEEPAAASEQTSSDNPANPAASQVAAGQTSAPTEPSPNNQAAATGLVTSPPAKGETPAHTPVTQGQTGNGGAPPASPTSGQDQPGCLKHWRWLLLLLLLLLLLFFLLRSCSSDVVYLPAKPGKYVPIDTTKIIKDTASHAYVVSNRLNVALVGDNKSLKEFAEKFKALYPGDEYSIIYYDTTVHRLQIQIPDNKRVTIKSELKSKLPEFSLLIWDENLFEQSKIPSDAAFNDLEKSWYLTSVEATDAWDLTMGDSNIVVAVIDNAFDLNHEELKGRIVAPWNVVRGDNVITATGDQAHGTHVASTILGHANNNAGLSGVAPNCKLMPIQAAFDGDKFSSSAIIDGVIYAINHGASIINMSLGMTVGEEVKSMSPEEQEQLIKTTLKDAEGFWNELFKYAYQKNIIIVLAGGNQNVLIGLDAMDRTPYTINVSAVNVKDEKWEHSNYGARSTISAPGAQIFNAIPGDNYGFMSGTSMASPIVAGGVALIRSVNPGMSFNDIVKLMQTTGRPVKGGANVGKILQLAKALGVAKSKRTETPVVKCPDRQKLIDSLTQVIERLRSECK